MLPQAIRTLDIERQRAAAAEEEKRRRAATAAAADAQRRRDAEAVAAAADAERQRAAAAEEEKRRRAAADDDDARRRRDCFGDGLAKVGAASCAHAALCTTPNTRLTPRRPYSLMSAGCCRRPHRRQTKHYRGGKERRHWARARSRHCRPGLHPQAN